MRWGTYFAVCAAVISIGLALGVTMPLVSLRLESWGYDSFAIGVMAATPAVGVLLGALLAGRLAARFGTTVNGIRPGFIDTPMTAAMPQAAQEPPQGHRVRPADGAEQELPPLGGWKFFVQGSHAKQQRGHDPLLPQHEVRGV